MPTYKMDLKDQYQSPLIKRYSSYKMSNTFSDQNRYFTFRRLWLELARAQKELGLPITNDQISEMEGHLKDIDFQKVHSYEKQLRHDVMAHIYAFGDVCPLSRPIIHLGATSCFVTDNADLILIKQGLQLVLSKLLKIIHALSEFAKKHADTACLGFTHFQAAQPTTVGKRACLWLQELVMDFHQGEKLFQSLPFLGVKGATGTQASFVNLFEGDSDKVKELDKKVADAFQFEKVLIISGQTYTRKIDAQVLQFLENIAVSLHKSSTDLRLLSHMGEIREKFEDKQVGSSAMPYKKNPIYSERICSLSRFLISLSQNPSYTAATQWLERSLDDSANRRIVIPEGFLTADAICNIFHNMIGSLFVDRDMIQKNLREKLPFVAMENVLMIAVKKGADRQHIHEKLRTIAQKDPTHFFDEIDKNQEIPLTKSEIALAKDESRLIGRAPSQVHEYIAQEVAPILAKAADFQTDIPKVEI